MQLHITMVKILLQKTSKCLLVADPGIVYVKQASTAWE